jgi:hypothetical protein
MGRTKKTVDEIVKDIVEDDEVQMAIDTDEDQEMSDIPEVAEPVKVLDIDSMFEKVEAAPEETYRKTYTRTDPEWRDYVLGELLEDEMDAIGGNPTVDGLRRLAEKFVGTIVENETIIIDSPKDYNGFRTTCTVQVTYDTGERLVKWSGSADACKENIKGDPYNLFSTSVAETRAEGRAHKKALGLRKVVSADELLEPTCVEFITSTQINVIDVMCRRLDVNVMSLIGLSKTKYASIDRMPKNKATTVITLLNNYERGEGDSKMNERIDKIKGYKTDWRGN